MSSTDSSLVSDLLEAERVGEIEDFGIGHRDAVRSLLLGDLFLFAWMVFQYRDLKRGLHDEIASLLGEWGKPDLRRVLIQIPREFFKTSLATRANALWQVARGFYYGADEAILIVNEKSERAESWIRAIRDVAQSSKVLHTFLPEFLPPGVRTGDKRSLPRSWKWNDQEISFQRNSIGVPESSITATGIESASTGGHWPTIIMDDLISLKHALSAPEMERAREWVKRHHYLMRPVENGRGLCICTPWSYSDVYTNLISDFNYAVYRRSALEDADGEPDLANGASIFPEKLPTHQLREMEKRDPFTFASQMMCRPKAGKETTLSPESIRYGMVVTYGPETWFEIDRDFYDPLITAVDDESAPPRRVYLHQMTKRLLFDPAPSRPTEQKSEPRARNALIMEGLDPWGRRFLLEVRALRKDPLDVMDAAFEMCSRWGCDTVSVEEVNFSKLYAPFMRYMTKVDARYAQTLRFIPYEPGKVDKHARIRSRFPLFQRGFYYLNRELCQLLVREALEYPNGETNDILDALAQDESIPRPATILEEKIVRYQSFKEAEGRDEFTNYGPAMGRDPVDG